MTFMWRKQASNSTHLDHNLGSYKKDVFWYKSVQKLNERHQFSFDYSNNIIIMKVRQNPTLQGGQDHFFPKEMLISLSILKLHKYPWIWEGLRTIHFI